MTGQDAAVKTLPFTFSGTTREFFGIWIVNALLTAITFGLYTPWAKVRTRRYFYGNTLLDDAPFDYLASPRAIFKGWMIAAGVFILYSLVTSILPWTTLPLMLVFLLLMPWVIVRAMAFRLRNSAYRSIRFRFDKDYREALKIFVGLALLVPLTLGAIFPYVMYRQKRFFVNHAAYGEDLFSLPEMGRQFYEIYLVVIMVFSAIIMVLGFTLPVFVSPTVTATVTPFVAMMVEGQVEMQAQIELPWAPIILFIAMVMTPFLSYPYLQAAVNNVLWNNINLAGQRFRSSLRTRDLVWLYSSNAVLVALSFGLLIPWTKIRLARYRVERMSMLSSGDLNRFVAGAASKEGATADELGEAFDVDIGL